MHTVGSSVRYGTVWVGRYHRVRLGKDRVMKERLRNSLAALFGSLRELATVMDFPYDFSAFTDIPRAIDL